MSTCHTEPCNPECVQGKHRNCDGTAWADDLDRITECECPCHSEDEAEYSTVTRFGTTETRIEADR